MASPLTLAKRHYPTTILVGGTAFSVGIHQVMAVALGRGRMEEAAAHLQQEVYPLLVSVGGTLLGFTVAGVSIILGLSKEPLIDLLRKEGLLTEIHRSFFSTIHWLALLTITALVFVGLGSRSLFWGLLILNVLFVQSILRLGVSYWILRKTLHLVAKPDST